MDNQAVLGVDMWVDQSSFPQRWIMGPCGRAQLTISVFNFERETGAYEDEGDGFPNMRLHMADVRIRRFCNCGRRSQICSQMWALWSLGSLSFRSSLMRVSSSRLMQDGGIASSIRQSAARERGCPCQPLHTYNEKDERLVRRWITRTRCVNKRSSGIPATVIRGLLLIFIVKERTRDAYFSG